MISFLSDLLKGFAGLVYPVTCEVCGTKINTDIEEGCLCHACFKQMVLTSAANPLRRGKINVWAVCAYEGVARQCIRLLKYKGRIGLLKPLSGLMQNFTNLYLKPYKFDIIVPVPLHRNRLRQRSFNQAELLAKNLAKYTGRPVCAKAVKRVKPTLAQTGLSKTKRFANLRGAFRINDAGVVAGKNVLMIDDVFTTGSTVSECAKTLYKAKVKSVSVLVLARGI